MFKMGSHCSFGHLKHKLWPKEGSGVDPIYLFTDDVRHTIRKLSTRATILLEIASWFEVCSQSYEAPKLRESHLGRFQDSHLGVPGQKAIWMWAPWKGAEYTIRGKWWLPPSSGRGESCVSVLPVARPSTKSVLTMH